MNGKEKKRREMKMMMMKRVILMLALLCATNGGAEASRKLIETVCKDCSVREFCIEALVSDPAALKASSPMGLAKATVELMIKNTTASEKYLKKECGGGSAVKQCVGSFSSAVQSFKLILTELDQDTQTANYDIFSSIDYAVQCNATLFAASSPVPSAVSDRLHLLFNFIQVGFRVTDALQ